MKTLGIVVEYNPFHKGHLYHLKSAIELTKPDFTVAIMSGNFVQRGEPAIVDKFSRAEMALRAGVDVVLELPAIYAIQDASGFARGSISSFNLTNSIDNLVFGSESNDIKTIEKIASLIADESEEFRDELRINLKKGLSFPNARRLAISKISEENSDNMKYSNDILGIEYVVALKKINSKIKPYTIKRIGSNYNDEELTKIPSATAIRRAIFDEKKIEGLPDFSYEILRREFDAGHGPVFFEDFFDFLRQKLILLRREGIGNIYGFNEGLSERFFKSACLADNLKNFLKLVGTKRFTLTRIKRRMMYAIFDLKREFLIESNEFGPQYLRLIGFRKNSSDILRIISDNSSIPLITNLSEFKNSIRIRNVNTALAWEQLNFDLKVTDFYRMHFKQRVKICNGDFRKPIIYEG